MAGRNVMTRQNDAIEGMNNIPVDLKKYCKGNLYRKGSVWNSSYPEKTGYRITLLPHVNKKPRGNAAGLFICPGFFSFFV